MEEVNLSDLSAQALADLAELLADIEIPEVTYAATYDPLTGEVKSVGPSEAFVSEEYKISVDQETAIDIIEGRIKINNCYVDVESEELEIIEVKNVFKIDDILHRVPVVQWSEVEKPELFITYLTKTNKLKFQLSEEFYGTKKLAKKFQPIKQKKTRWSGDTTLTFLLTDYNDPHAIKEVVSFRIDDLIGKTKIIKNIDLPNRFSVFTRRIFKNYVLDIK